MKETHTNARPLPLHLEITTTHIMPQSYQKAISFVTALVDNIMNKFNRYQICCDLAGTQLKKTFSAYAKYARVRHTTSDIMRVTPHARAQLYCELDMFVDEMTVEHFKQ